MLADAPAPGETPEPVPFICHYRQTGELVEFFKVKDGREFNLVVRIDGDEVRESGLFSNDRMALAWTAGYRANDDDRYAQLEASRAER